MNISPYTLWKKHRGREKERKEESVYVFVLSNAELEYRDKQQLY